MLWYGNARGLPTLLRKTKRENKRDEREDGDEGEAFKQKVFCKELNGSGELQKLAEPHMM